jgi:hypothetical protein
MPICIRKPRLGFLNRPCARGGIVREDSRRQCGGIAGNCRPKCNRERRSCTRLGSISKDPIGFAAGDVNQYRYVGNGPTNATDPSGLQERNPYPVGTEEHFRWRERHGSGTLRAAGIGALHSTNKWAYKSIQPTLVTVQDVSAEALSLGLKNNYEIATGYNPVRGCEVSDSERAVRFVTTYGAPIVSVIASKLGWLRQLFGKADEVADAAPVAPGSGLGALRDRVRALGTDPARGLIRAEGIGGVRVERALGRAIHRSADEAIDFVDDVLGPISLKGPIPCRGSVKGLANAAIKDAKFNTATNALFVDLRGLSAADKALVRQLVTKGAVGTRKIIRFLD